MRPKIRRIPECPHKWEPLHIPSYDDDSPDDDVSDDPDDWVHRMAERQPWPHAGNTAEVCHEVEFKRPSEKFGSPRYKKPTS